MEKILITYYENADELYEELYEKAYNELAAEGYSEEEHGEYHFQHLLDTVIENILLLGVDEVDEVYDAYDLAYWWKNNGWTLDRGYGGPNYKERVFESTDWDQIYDYITSVMDINKSWGCITMTPTEVNDLVIFWEDPEDWE